MNDNSARPNLHIDKDYLKKVADSMQKRGALEEIHFKYLTDVFSLLGVTQSVYEKIEAGLVPEEVKQMIVDTFKQLNALEIIPEELTQKLYRLWDYLAESEEPEPVDLIYVFGSPSDLPALEGIRLKLAGFAPKILFSGKQASYQKDIENTEAEKYAQMAIEAGVPSEDILLEKESINTPENIMNSAKMLHEMNFLPKKMIIITSPYHLRRASLTMRAGFDWEFILIRRPFASWFSRDTYFKDEKGWSYVCFEYLKLYGARQMGHF